jgi:hypothetical protein
VTIVSIVLLTKESGEQAALCPGQMPAGQDDDISVFEVNAHEPAQLCQGGDLAKPGYAWLELAIRLSQLLKRIDINACQKRGRLSRGRRAWGSQPRDTERAQDLQHPETFDG